MTVCAEMTQRLDHPTIPEVARPHQRRRAPRIRHARPRTIIEQRDGLARPATLYRVQQRHVGESLAVGPRIEEHLHDHADCLRIPWGDVPRAPRRPHQRIPPRAVTALDTGAGPDEHRDAGDVSPGRRPRQWKQAVRVLSVRTRTSLEQRRGHTRVPLTVLQPPGRRCDEQRVLRADARRQQPPHGLRVVARHRLVDRRNEGGEAAHHLIISAGGGQRVDGSQQPRREDHTGRHRQRHDHPLVPGAQSWFIRRSSWSLAGAIDRSGPGRDGRQRASMSFTMTFIDR